MRRMETRTLSLRVGLRAMLASNGIARCTERLSSGMQWRLGNRQRDTLSFGFSDLSPVVKRIIGCALKQILSWLHYLKRSTDCRFTI
jgi:hypothetical protein